MRRPLALLAAMIIQLCISLSAQENKPPAVVTIIVTDHFGAVITDAEVKLFSTSTSEQKILTNSADGRYTLTVTPGYYELQVNSGGFCRANKADTAARGSADNCYRNATGANYANHTNVRTVPSCSDGV